MRIIPSVFPPADLFRRVTARADLDAVHAIEDAFNPRLRTVAGGALPFAVDERVVGPGAAYIMAAFTHLSGRKPVQRRLIRRLLRGATRADRDR